MAKNKKNNGLFDVSDLAKNAQKNIEERSTTHNTHNTQDTPNTQRKQKHPRINMAFYGDNLDYVREAAYQSRMSVTEYINQLIVDDKNRKFLQSQRNTIVTPEGTMEQLNIDDVK